MAIQVMIFMQFTCGKYGKWDLHADFVRLFFHTEIRTYGNTNIKKCLIRFCDMDKSRTDKVCQINNLHTWKRSLSVTAFDFIINVGHSDLYFMVQWFCPWELFDVHHHNCWTMSQCDSTFDLIVNVGHKDIFHGPVILPFILKANVTG